MSTPLKTMAALSTLLMVTMATALEPNGRNTLYDVCGGWFISLSSLSMWLQIMDVTVEESVITHIEAHYLLGIIVKGREGQTLTLLWAVVVGTAQCVLSEIVIGQETVIVHLIDPLVAVHQLRIQRLTILWRLLGQERCVTQMIGSRWHLQCIYQLLHFTKDQEQIQLIRISHLGIMIPPTAAAS